MSIKADRSRHQESVGVADARNSANNRRLLVLVVYAICITTVSAVGCVDRPKLGSHKVNGNPTFSVTPAAGVRLPQQMGPAVIDQCTRQVPTGITGYWEPDSVTISQLEEKLPELFLRIATEKGRKSFGTDEYYRQYVGLVRHGHKVIYVNGFHRGYVHPREWLRDSTKFIGAMPDSASWRTRPVNVCDGGFLYFGVEYDVVRREFGRIDFNQRV